MKKTLAYAILVLGLLGGIAATYSIRSTSSEAVRTADFMPWPPH